MRFDEPVDLYPKSKRSGGYRLISDPGIENRTRQKLVVRAMEPTGTNVFRDDQERLTRLHDLFEQRQHGLTALTKNCLGQHGRGGDVWAARFSLSGAIRSDLPNLADRTGNFLSDA